VQQQTGVSVPLVDVNDPAEKELRNLMIADDAAMDEVNDWINTNSIARTNAPAIEEFNKRIIARFEVAKHGYESFLRNHPDSARGFLAYGSFLNDIGNEDGARVQYENSRQLDPKNPAVWNQLANYFGEHGELTNAFADYTEAIRLDPAEPVYYQNFATTVYLYRKDAREFYGINEQQVFDKALGLYRQAMKLAPQNLVLAVDYAESYYGIKPLRTNDALVAWTNALNIAKDDNEREGVLLHLARVKISAGFYDEAQAHLDAVTNAAFAEMRDRLARSLADHKNPPTNSAEEISTNSVVASTNLAAAMTNVVNSMTNQLPVLTNGLPALTNPPVFSPKIVAVMTNVPPVAPKASDLQAAPPPLREQKP
jgi:cytochrome c-type biogenesis protein CcmH/NrfG